MDKIASYFKFKERNTRLNIEIVAGITTFITMSYIIFLQPAIMSGKMFNMDTGMNFGALLTGCCLAAAFASILMGILANYPIALAPGMGENFYFVLALLPACVTLTGKATAWQLALGVVFVSGVIFAILSFLNVRKIILGAVSPSLQHAIAAGIGLFIALIGLRNAELITTTKAGLYHLTANLLAPSTAIFLVGLLVTSGLHVLKVRGSILLGILAAAFTALCFGKIGLKFPFSTPPSIAPVFAKLNLVDICRFLPKLIPYIVIFTFMDIFDTLGTLIGVSTKAGIMKDGRLPNSTKAFASDACGTVFGSICGHSTITAYIESATGVEYGGRTGVTAIVTGICFLLAPFLAPFIGAVAACGAVTAPALVIVGAMMLSSVTKINWDDYSELIPAFLILVGIPMTYNIGDGIMIGFIAYPLIKLVGGKYKDLTWVNYLIGIVLVLYFIFIKS